MPGALYLRTPIDSNSNMAPILDYSRTFQMWEFLVGHRQLLLRSPKSEEHNTRIDILFKDVSEICLPTILTGLTVSVTPRSHPGAQGSEYCIKGNEYEGRVAAGSMHVHEDTLEYYDDSFFRLRPPRV
jgi:hypothetical protein